MFSSQQLHMFDELSRRAMRRMCGQLLGLACMHRMRPMLPWNLHVEQWHMQLRTRLDGTVMQCGTMSNVCRLQQPFGQHHGYLCQAWQLHITRCLFVCIKLPRSCMRHLQDWVGWVPHLFQLQQCVCVWHMPTWTRALLVQQLHTVFRSTMRCADVLWAFSLQFPWHLCCTRCVFVCNQLCRCQLFHLQYRIP